MNIGNSVDWDYGKIVCDKISKGDNLQVWVDVGVEYWGGYGKGV